MLHRVVLPQLGQTMEEGTVERWHKREGDSVRKGEVLYELTTDKATLEVEAFVEGILKRVLVEEGQTVPVNELIAIIGEENDELPEDLGQLGPRRPTAAEAAPGTDAAEARASSAETMVAGSKGVVASPRARKMAREKEVPLEALRGSGPGGRVVERDVLDYLASLDGFRFTPAAAVRAYELGISLPEVAAGVGDRRVRTADVEAAAQSGVGRVPAARAGGERLPFTPMRRTIADRMTAAKQTVPHFYLVGEVMMRAATEFLERSGPQAGSTTPTALLVKAVAVALKKHPRVNARFDGDAVALNSECNVGVAVAVKDGLFVPVIRQADMKGLAEISSELKSLAELARAGKLTPDQYEGGSITVSNLGMYGVRYFLPIINPPESCIIGVGEIRDQVVASEGGVRVEPVVELSLSVDHRVIDGAEAAEFFRSLRNLLEAPDALVT
ncbi:MAG: dihydrolipoamide acetyltransferase family protein [Planctomycetota bacterium]|jgi:pyruvate dehydrogenase E2 component (dihydrolipoamide acetyltransferase)